MVEQHAMLSTKDNPWNPFTNWNEYSHSQGGRFPPFHTLFSSPFKCDTSFLSYNADI